jgi:hypothetical protein
MTATGARPPGARRRALAGTAATVTALAVALVPAGCGRTSVACSLPVVTVSQAQVHPGDTITVMVDNAYAGCGDTGEGRVRPEPNVEVTLVSGARSQLLLGSADTDGAGRATLVAAIPPDTAPGTARIVVTNLPSAGPTTLTVER